jgi:hypothetical protein
MRPPDFMKISGNPQPSGLTLNARAQSARTDTSGRTKEMSPQEKNLRALKERLGNLQAMLSPKQEAAAKLSRLKRLLDTMMTVLKATLQIMTPEQAKNMVRRLKSIAKELAAVAHSLNSENGKSRGAVTLKVDITRPDATMQTASQAEGAAREAARQAAGAANEAQSEAAAASASAKTLAMEEAGEADGPDGEASGSRGATASDQGLRRMLKETTLLLKALLSLLKTRLKDREGKEEAVTVGKYITELERELGQGYGVDVGTDAGIGGMRDAPVSTDAPATVSINVRV